MEILQTKLLLEHIRNGYETGKLLITDLEYNQLISGLEYPILPQKTSLQFLILTEHTWMTDYKKILQETQGELQISNQWLPSKQRKHEKFLMTTFSKYTNDKESLKILYNCRLYLQIFTLVDIISSDGIKILKNPLYGNKNPHAYSTLTWPKQQKPEKAPWKNFQTLCIPFSTTQIHIY